MGDEPISELLQPIAGLDQVVHSPARLMILTYLFAVASADFIFLMRETGLTRGNLSTHLSKLEEAGYVEVLKTYAGKKPQTQLSLTKAGRAALKTYREQMQQILASLPD